MGCVGKQSQWNYDEYGNLWISNMFTHHVPLRKMIHTKRYVKRNRENRWGNPRESASIYQGQHSIQAQKKFVVSISFKKKCKKKVTKDSSRFELRTASLHTQVIAVETWADPVSHVWETSRGVGWVDVKTGEDPGSHVWEAPRGAGWVAVSAVVDTCWSIVYYESIKRDLQRRLIYEYRCDERLKTKNEESTRLADTGFIVVYYKSRKRELKAGLKSGVRKKTFFFLEGDLSSASPHTLYSVDLNERCLLHNALPFLQGMWTGADFHVSVRRG